MLEINSEVLLSWVQGLLLPLFRILGFMATAPFFSEPSVPTSIKLGLGLMITLTVMTAVGQPFSVDLLSLRGAMTIASQLFIGLTIGFVLKLTFAMIDFAGQFIGLMIGFGFASFYDVRSGAGSTSINILLNILVLLIFISINGHLLVLALLIDSLHTLPASDSILAVNHELLLKLSADIFSVGLKIALPIAAILLIVNMSMAILSRAAPQLNLFVIGFPITLAIGTLALYFTLDSISAEFQKQLTESFSLAQRIFTLNK